MPDLGSLYGVPGGAPAGGFDILGPQAAQQGSPVFNTVPLQGQGQGGGQPMSPQQAQQLAQLMQMGGLSAGSGQSQPQPYQGSPLMAGILGLPRYGGPGQGAQQQQPGQQGNGLASAVGSGLRSLFDGIVGS